jgi:hypothetical protein
LAILVNWTVSPLPLVTALIHGQGGLAAVVALRRQHRSRVAGAARASRGSGVDGVRQERVILFHPSGHNAGHYPQILRQVESSGDGDLIGLVGGIQINAPLVRRRVRAERTHPGQAGCGSSSRSPCLRGTACATSAATVLAASGDTGNRLPSGSLSRIAGFPKAAPGTGLPEACSAAAGATGASSPRFR